LERNDFDVGGIMVPFFITEQEAGYLGYAAVHRGVLNQSEAPLPGVYFPVQFQDSLRGGFQTSFWGSRSAFAAYFQLAQFGLIYSGLRSSKSFDCSSVSEINGYDFEELSEDCGCGTKAISTWSNWEHDANRAVHAIAAGRIDRYHRYFEKLRVASENSIRRLNPDISIELQGSILEKLCVPEGIIVDVETINMISRLFVLKSRYLDSVNEIQEAERAKQELMIWKTHKEKLKIRIWLT
jgi:hypothetical protein